MKAHELLEGMQIILNNQLITIEEVFETKINTIGIRYNNDTATEYFERDKLL